MVDFAYLYRGLCGLSRAHRANSMAGHLGAAVVAGYLYGEDNADLAPDVGEAVGGYLDRLVAGEEPIWFDPDKTGITVSEMFAPWEPEEGDPAPVGDIAAALSGNIGEFRQSGHNVIFASLALRALSDHPRHATPAVVGGICRLIEGFDSSGGGRAYFGEERGWIEAADIPVDDSFPTYDTLEGMAALLLDELPDSPEDRRRGVGGPQHVVNHAAALIDLTAHGYGDLARQGFAAQRRHVQLWRALPKLTDELGPIVKAPLPPTDAEFWRTAEAKNESASLTHRIKTLYGFGRLMTVVEDAAAVRDATDKLQYLI
jgi:hypothetical protein